MIQIIRPIYSRVSLKLFSFRFDLIFHYNLFRFMQKLTEIEEGRRGGETRAVMWNSELYPTKKYIKHLCPYYPYSPIFPKMLLMYACLYSIIVLQSLGGQLYRDCS